MNRIFTAALVAAITLQAQTARVGVGVVEHKLTLSDAVVMALKNNLEVSIEKTNTSDAEQAVRLAKGAFDPTFRWQPSVENRNTPSSSSLQGVNGKLAERFFVQNFAFHQATPWMGASFDASFNNNRTSSNNAFSSLNPYITSQLNFTFTMPLLRNRATDRQRSEILIRNKQVGVTETGFELKVIDVVARVEQAYWDLVGARQDATVEGDAVELATKQLEQNQRMIDSGALAPVELSASQAELERRRDTYLASVGTLTEAENNLKTLLLPHRQDEMWGEAILPVDTRISEEPRNPDDLREAVAAALKQRPELRQLALETEANGIEENFRADQTKPQVNLVAGYTNAGLAGSLQPSTSNPFSSSLGQIYQRLNVLSAAAALPPVVPASFGSLPNTIVGGYGTTLASVFGGKFPSVQAGVQFDLTFRNRAAQAGYSQSLIAGKRLKYQMDLAEQTIEAQVRNALQAIQTARQRIAAAEASERAANEKLASETRLFKTGESTNFLVLTRQNEYLDSRRRVVVAHLDYNKAVARLEQAAGDTLSAHHVKLP